MSRNTRNTARPNSAQAQAPIATPESSLPNFPDGEPLKLNGKSSTTLTEDMVLEITELKKTHTWNEIRGFLGDAGFNGSRMRSAHAKANEGNREYPWKASKVTTPAETPATEKTEAAA